MYPSHWLKLKLFNSQRAKQLRAREIPSEQGMDSGIGNPAIILQVSDSNLEKYDRDTKWSN